MKNLEYISNRQNLITRNFSISSIQGISFKNSILKNGNFCNAKAGISFTSRFGILCCCLLASLISEIIVFWGGVAIVFSSSHFVVGLVLFFIFLAFILCVIYAEFRTTLICFIVITLSLIVLMIAISPPSEQFRFYTLSLAFGLVLKLGFIGGFTILIESNIILRTIISNSQNLLLLSVFAILPMIGGIYTAILSGISLDLKDFPLFVAFSLFITVFLTVLAVYISWRTQLKDRKYLVLRSLAITICSIKGTNFQGADLTDADFTEAILGNTNFTKANLTRTCWRNARNLDKARVEGTYLENEKIRQLVVTGDGRGQNFDGLDLRGCNLRNADLTDASFIGTKLSEATLEGANLTRAKLVKAQMYGTNLTNAILTGACIQDWAISLDTQLEGIKCEYIYMRLSTTEDPDPWRKPDNRDETFKDGDFTDFIAPIIKTQKLYQTQNVDLRKVAENYTILDIFHHQGVDPSAAAAAFQKLIEKYPEAGLKLISMEGRGNEKIHFQAQVTDDVNRSVLSQEYSAIYNDIKSGTYSDLQVFLAAVAEKDQQILRFQELLENAIQQPKFYVETYREININDKGTYIEGDYHNNPE